MMIGIGLIVLGLAVFVVCRLIAGKIKNRENAKFEAEVNKRVEKELEKREKEWAENAQKLAQPVTETKAIEETNA